MEQPLDRKGISVWKWALLPWMAAVTWMAYFWAQDLKAFVEPSTARIIFWHVPMAWLGMLWFWIGAVYGALFLFGKRRGQMAVDRKVQHGNEIGLICTVLATVTGSVFAARQWGTPWNWDPKQVSITVLIVIYLAYFGLRMSINDADLRARLSAVYAIIGAVATPFLMFIVPQLEAVRTLHPPNTTITGGLDSKWRLIYMMAFFGFLGITSWTYQLRLRVAEVEAAELGRLAGAAEEAVRTEARRKPAAGGPQDREISTS